MFERERLLGKTGRSIVLQTHRGNPIENEIQLEPDWHRLNIYKIIFDKHRPKWIERKPPCGVYNCVGHVWACRRTGVFDPGMEDKVSLIFEDDGYRTVNWPSEPLMVGDLVTYWESVQKRKFFYHVGIVVELRMGLTNQSPKLPWVLSKWDATSGEVLHHYLEHPFPDGPEVQFWTDRPHKQD